MYLDRTYLLFGGILTGSLVDFILHDSFRIKVIKLRNCPFQQKLWLSERWKPNGRAGRTDDR